MHSAFPHATALSLVLKHSCSTTNQTYLIGAVVQAPKVIGSTGKILKSGPEDRVFVYYADHGAPGVFSVPSGMPRVASAWQVTEG